MNEQEMLSWIEHCAVCGRDLTPSMISNKLTCVIGHGTFLVVNGQIIFELDPNLEAIEE